MAQADPVPGSSYANAVGKLAEVSKLIFAPVSTYLQGHAEASKVRRIAKAEVATAELRERAQMAHELRVMQHQHNMEQILAKAETQLPVDADANPLDPYWLAKFRRAAQDVQDETVQELWAKLLCGEIERPGSFSLRLISFLELMSTEEAHSFVRFYKYTWRDREGNRAYQVFTRETESLLRDRQGFDFHFYQTLDDLGLITNQTLVLRSESEFGLVLAYGRRGFRFSAEKTGVTIHIRRLTKVGSELGKLCEHKLDPEYLDVLLFSLPDGVTVCDHGLGEPPRPLAPEIAEQVASHAGKAVADVDGDDYGALQELKLCKGNEQGSLPLLTALQKIELINAPLAELDVLRSFPLLEEIRFSGGSLPDLSSLRELPRLRRISLDAYSADTLRVLASLEQLEFLSVGLPFEGPPVDLSPLGKLTSLKSLCVVPGSIKSLDWIAKLTQLESLCLNQTDVVDLSALAVLQTLQALYMRGTKVEDLSPLRRSAALRKLDMTYTQVSDLEPLGSCTDMEVLKLGGTKVQDLSPLGTMGSLRELELWSTRVGDVSPLASCVSLEKLRLSGTAAGTIEPLRSLKHLTKLHLQGTAVGDSSALTGMAALADLNLSKTGIQELHGLRGAKTLRALDLSGLELDDLEPLRGCQNLERLSLRESALPGVDCLAELGQLRVVDLSGAELSEPCSIGALRQIESLCLSGLLTEVSFLSKLDNLVELSLAEVELPSLELLSGMGRLTTLVLRDIKARDFAALSSLPRLVSIEVTGEYARKRDLLPLVRANPRLIVHFQNWVHDPTRD